MDGRILPDTGENASTPGVVTLEVGAENEVPSKVEEPLNQVLDAIGALKYLQEVPYVDSDRVAVMGWALGAETALGAIDASSWAGGQA
jgi:dienelactone hydrolase